MNDVKNQLTEQEQQLSAQLLDAAKKLAARSGAIGADDVEVAFGRTRSGWLWTARAYTHGRVWCEAQAGDAETAIARLVAWRGA